MKWKHDLGLRGLKLLNVLLMTACFAFVWYRYYAEASEYYRLGHYAVIALFAALYIVLGRTYDAFLVSYNSPGQIIYSQGLALFLTDAFMVILMWLLFKHFPVLWPGLVALAVAPQSALYQG